MYTILRVEYLIRAEHEGSQDASETVLEALARPPGTKPDFELDHLVPTVPPGYSREAYS